MPPGALPAAGPDPDPLPTGGAGPAKTREGRREVGGGGFPFGVGRVDILPGNRAFIPLCRSGAGGAGGGCVRGAVVPGEGDEERPRRARSPLDRRIRSPAAAAGPP